MSRPRSLGTSFLRWLGESNSPVYAVDERRSIVYANAAVETWLGVDVELLAGVRCDYHSPLPAETPNVTFLAAAMCPPPESFAGRRRAGVVSIRTVSGVVSRRRCDYLPLTGESLEAAGVLVVVSPIELDEAEWEEGLAGEAAEQMHSRLQAVRQNWWDRFQVDGLVGDSPAMKKAREQARWAAEGRARIVIAGPEGSGREYLARAIHRGQQSPPSPLVVWDASLLDVELLQRAIDAVMRGRGENVAATTVLIKEIDRLPCECQQMLASVLLSARHAPRTLATSTQSLSKLTPEGAFRPDLASWLGTVEIEIPPLRQRGEDIPWVVQAAIEQFNSRGKRQFTGVTAEALEQLARYPWPGESREVAKFLEEACGRAAGPLVTADDLPSIVRHAVQADRAPRAAAPIKLDELLADLEREILRRTLAGTRGNRAQAARWLGISRPRLLRRLEQLGLSEESPIDFE